MRPPRMNSASWMITATCRSYDPMVVYVAYEKKWPHLPIAVADTPKELGMILGVNKNYILSSISNLKNGHLKNSRYHRVVIEDDDEE